MEDILKIEHLHKAFDGFTVLEDVNLTVKKGEVTVVIGPSGCGKSTFLRLPNSRQTKSRRFRRNSCRGFPHCPSNIEDTF